MESRPKISSSYDVYDFIQDLYKDDVPEYKDYLHIWNSFKKYPSFISPYIYNLIYSEGKYGELVITTNGFRGDKKAPFVKSKYLVEIDKTFLTIHKQAKPRQRQKDFEHVNTTYLDELF